MSNEVVGQDDGALQAGVCPLGTVGIGDKKLRDGDGLDLVGLLGHEPLDGVLVVVVQNGRHDSVADGGACRTMPALHSEIVGGVIPVGVVKMLRSGFGMTGEEWR